MKKNSLKKDLGLLQVTFCGVGIIIGAGIYALVGKAVGLSGNMVWLSFILAALAASLTGLSYAELSSLFPKAGAEFEYSSKAFGKRIGFIIGMLTIFAGIIGSATVALGFAGYFSALVNLPIILTAISLVIILSIIIFLGIRDSALLAMIFTIAASIGLGAIIIVGIPYFGNVNYFEMAETGLFGVVSAASLIFFAFIGFDSIVNLAEDTKNAEKTIPKALILSIVISTLIYILVALASISILPWEQLALSEAPLVDVMTTVLGSEAGAILGFVALFATASTVLLLLIAMSRIMYGMARSNVLPKILSRINSKTNSPGVAILVIGLITISFIVIGKIELVANLTNFSIFVVFIFINASLIKFRFSIPNKHRPFKTPFNIKDFPLIPFLGIFVCGYLLLNVELEAMIYGSLLIIGFILLQILLSRK